MLKIFASDKVYVSRSNMKNAGNGVFAKRSIKKGEIIETAPFVEIVGDITSNNLFDYIYHFGKKKTLKAFVLGFGSIYNHSLKPNIKYVIKRKEKLIEYIALKNIRKDEEVLFNYYGSRKSSNKSKLWFE